MTKGREKVSYIYIQNSQKAGQEAPMSTQSTKYKNLIVSYKLSLQISWQYSVPTDSWNKFDHLKISKSDKIASHCINNPRENNSQSEWNNTELRAH